MDDIIIKQSTLDTGRASHKAIKANGLDSLKQFLKWAAPIVKDGQSKYVIDHYRAVTGIEGKPEGEDAGEYTKLTSAVALVEHFGTPTKVLQARKAKGTTESNPSYLQTRLITNGGGSPEPKPRDWDKWAKSVTKDLSKREINKAIKALQALV